MVEIVWEAGSLGGVAQSVVDVLGLINRLALMKSPTSPVPVRWRWIGCDGRPIVGPDQPLKSSSARSGHARSGTMHRQAPLAYRSLPDVIVVPGWVARDGPEIDAWVNRSSALQARLKRALARGHAILGVFTGVALLAASDCLHKRRFAAPWPYFVSIMRHASSSSDAQRPILWTEAPNWTSDDRVWTCATPVATTEALLDLLRGTTLTDLSDAARDVLIPSPLRQGVAVMHARAEGPKLNRQRVPTGSVERARQWLLQHIAAPYDLTALAKAAATSPRTLARHFSATHGITPHHYLERLRVERACLLLQTTYVSVEEIGRSSGMPSPTTFRRIFKRHMGCLPGEYRTRYTLRTQRSRWSNQVVPELTP